MRYVSLLPLFALSLAACGRTGGEPEAAAQAAACAGDGPVVSDAWVRAAGEGQGTTAAYFTICNGGDAAVELVGIDTAVADIVELHETTKDEAGVASMEPLAGLTLAPDETASFAPGGKHVMLIGVREALSEGGSANFTLHFSDGSTVSVDAPVKAQGAEPHGEH